MRILVVDDSVDTVRMMAVLLKDEGYEVKTALDGLEAVDVARVFRPDVVLLDLTLPDISGLEVARQLRHGLNLIDCCIVAVSGHGAEHIPAGSPIDHHMTKPLDYRTLTRLLTSVATDPNGCRDFDPRPTSARV